MRSRAMIDDSGRRLRGEGHRGLRGRRGGLLVGGSTALKRRLPATRPIRHHASCGSRLKSVLRGPDAVQQLAIDGLTGQSQPRDVTRQARYASSDSTGWRALTRRG